MELVVRTHQAVVYEMNTAAAPEIAIAESKVPLLASGLNTTQKMSL